MKRPDPMEAEHAESQKTKRLLDRLDGLGDWLFLAVLWLARWPIILAMSPFGGAAVPPMSASDIIGFLLSGVILSPIVETLIECTLPYQCAAWLFWRNRPRPARPWGFIIVAALMMMIVHPVASWHFAFVTGAFLGYCYGHYGARSRTRAYVFTTLYHMGINTVGFSLFLLGLILS